MSRGSSVSESTDAFVISSNTWTFYFPEFENFEFWCLKFAYKLRSPITSGNSVISPNWGYDKCISTFWKKATFSTYLCNKNPIQNETKDDLVYEQMKIPKHVPSFKQGFVRQPCMIFLISSSSAFIPSILEYIPSLNCAKSSFVHSAATPFLIETQTKSVK